LSLAALSDSFRSLQAALRRLQSVSRKTRQDEHAANRLRQANHEDSTPSQRLFARIGSYLRSALWLILLLALVYALGRRWGRLPATGPFFDPYHGIWTSHQGFFEATGSAELLHLPGLKGRVVIKVDRDQIKHIFAENDEDLYFAQGFVVASDRLWQMEFLTRLADGRLSEMVGRRALEFDKMFTKLGLPEAAREAGALMMQDPKTESAITSYSNGVNAYIDTLTPATRPFEYRLLDRAPMRWDPRRSALLLKFMAYELSGFSYDLPLTRSYLSLSPDDFKDLFPMDLEIPEPIVPRGTKWKFSGTAPPAPKVLFQPNIQQLEPYAGPDPSNGSNNWAVTGKKSTTGLPILSNDVHLGLSLPALFYEIQLVSPTQNVYGATLPGSPGVILGFNNKIAWGVTNGGSDILDWYQIRYRDEHKSEYVFDGRWRPVISHEVQIPVRDEKPVTLVLRRTHLGPVVYDEGEASINPQIQPGLAMHWGALDASNELKTFLLLNHASSTEECHRALETYESPSQNFLCADNHGDVELTHTGRFPIRWKGQGRLIGDGTSSDYEWKGWIPRPELPSYKNPERGFLSSANQSPTDETYPYYLGWPFENPFRGMRINEILREKKKFSPEDFVKMQSDTLSVSSRMGLKPLLRALSASTLTPEETAAIDLLRSWDFRFEENSSAAPLYYAWYAAVENHIWGSRFPDPSKTLRPPIWRTLQILNADPKSKWFDDPMTDKHETLSDIALTSFKEAITDVSKKTGTSHPSEWRWADYRPTQFAHLGRIPGLGDQGFPAPGMEHTIFANNGNHGPAWKMVVALGPKPRAWGVYPGGQSGDPASPNYDQFLQSWRTGQMHEINYLMKTADPNPRLQREWTLTPATK
jgi:penicillin amidase